MAERGPGESYRPDDVPPSLFGAHQPGIVTPVLDHLFFVALDLRAGDRAELRTVIETVGEAAESLMLGHAGRVTVTIGFGPELFGARFGLESLRPVGLAPLPPFAGDMLDPHLCGGDVCIQVCADDAQTAEAAGERLLALGEAAHIRWSQRASMRRLATDPVGGRPRNLLGFKDATGNPRRGKDFDRHLWVSGRDRTWMVGGTYLVVRRVRIQLDAWEELSPGEQERVIGRQRDSGAPLGREHEFERMPLDDATIPVDAHARLAAPESNAGIRILRRGYSYDNGRDSNGRPDAGSLLLLYGRDPRRQYVPLQRRLAEHDALNRFTEPVGSAIFAIPPGAPRGRLLAHELFDR